MEARRTQKEIEKDYKKIRKVAKNVTSIGKISAETGLSEAQIKTTLSKHPTVYKQIKQQLSTNKQIAKLKKQRKKGTIKNEARKTSKKEANMLAKKIVKTNEECNKEDTVKFVIDASITGIKNLQDIILKICHSKAKVVLTSITIKELERMQAFDDLQGKDARHILAIAAENKESFEEVAIEENLETPDDCIIKYCAENKKCVTLLTSDKTMALKARMYGVPVEYFKQEMNIIKANTQLKCTQLRMMKIMTLRPTNKIGSQLFITNPDTNGMSIWVHSNGKLYNSEFMELKIGDDVFIATKKEDYISFAHFRIISLYVENNCKLVYSRRFYDYNDMDVPNKEYKTFLNDFKVRQGL